MRLQNYFRHEKTEITGGFRPYIILRGVRAYPVKWLDEFRLTTADPAAVRQLAELASVPEVLLRAFRQHEGVDEKATVARLLNPVNYVKLEFEMRNEDNLVNDGSNGQTFMAAALLNVARLAVVGRSGGPRTAAPGLRFMAIDETDGLGTNYTTLLELAAKENFQVVSLSIRPLTYEDGPRQRLYFLHLGRNRLRRQNLRPMMLSKGETVPAADEPFAPPADPTLFDPTPDADAQAY